DEVSPIILLPLSPRPTLTFSALLQVYQLYLAWESPQDDAIFHEGGEWLVENLTRYARAIGKDHRFIYLDYAYKNQKPLQSYGAANVQKMKAASQTYDRTASSRTWAQGGSRSPRKE